jgi:hypothetical protein
MWKKENKIEFSLQEGIKSTRNGIEGNIKDYTIFPLIVH